MTYRNINQFKVSSKYVKIKSMIKTQKKDNHINEIAFFVLI